LTQIKLPGTVRAVNTTVGILVDDCSTHAQAAPTVMSEATRQVERPAPRPWRRSAGM